VLIDSHCHLTMLDDPAGALARARAAGVGGVLTVCAHVGREGDRVISLAGQGGAVQVWATLGTHPHEADAEEVPTDTLVTRICDTPCVIGVGETGLDFYYDNAPREAQEASFRRHIRASVKAKVPLIVHTREAEEATMRIMEHEGAARAVMHCFTGSDALADWALARGYYISFSGIVTFKGAGALRAIAARVPADRLLIETDAPYLAPVPHRGARNAPALLVHTAACVAQVRGVEVAEIARVTRENFFRLFDRATPLDMD